MEDMDYAGKPIRVIDEPFYYDYDCTIDALDENIGLTITREGDDGNRIYVICLIGKNSPKHKEYDTTNEEDELIIELIRYAKNCVDNEQPFDIQHLQRRLVEINSSVVTGGANADSCAF